jgi:hypothetical protein
MPEIVAFDESGNTGDNLLDAAQPIYALASVHVDEQAAAALIAEVAPAADGELHYSRLRRSRQGRETILRILRSELLAPGRARLTPMHKPFSVVGRLFDYTMEATLYNGGLDVYDHGLQLAYTNLLYRRAPAACGEADWSQLLSAFVAACRDPSDENVERVRQANARCVLGATDETVQQLLMLIPPLPEWIRGRIAVDQGHGIGMRDMLDPAATSLVENCITWPDRVGPIVVMHDKSNVVARWRGKLAVLASPRATQEVGEYWAARLPYPLAVDEIRLVNSATSARLQLGRPSRGSRRNLAQSVHLAADSRRSVRRVTR